MELRPCSAKIAIVIPCYNGSQTIVDTVESVQEALLKAPVEKVILVDDRSTDDSVLKARASWHSHVTLEILTMEKNSGERAAVNRAASVLAKETYDWFLLLHADDIAKPDWTEKYCEAIKDASDTIGSFSAMWDIVRGNGRIELMKETNQKVDIHRAGKESFEETLRQGCWWKVSGSAIRITAFFDIGGFDRFLPQLGDWDFVLKLLASRWDVGFIPKSLTTCHRPIHSVSAKSFKSNRDLRERLIITARHVSQSPQLWNWWHRRYLLSCLRRTISSVLKLRGYRAIDAGRLCVSVCRSWRTGYE